MILFYSNYCPHCRMLLETIKIHDKKGLIKLASIDVLKSQGKILPQIHSVPALIINETSENKAIFYGKEVFDYLLLPKQGILLQQDTLANSSSIQQNAVSDISTSGTSGTSASLHEIEPSAFTISSSYSDSFSEVEDSQQLTTGYKDKAYSWTTIEDMDLSSSTLINNESYNEDTRTKRQLPDVSELRAQRDMELKQVPQTR